MATLKDLGLGIPMPGAIPGYAGGTFNMDGTQVTPSQTPQANMPSFNQRAPIMIDDGPQMGETASGLPAYLEAMRPQKRGTVRDILGTIFDAMSAFGGGQANYWNGVNADRKQFDDMQVEYAMLQERLAAQRQMKLQERAAKLAEPTTLERNHEYVKKSLGDDAGRAWLMKPQFVTDGYGSGTWASPGGDGAPDVLPPDFFDGGATGEQSPGFP